MIKQPMIKTLAVMALLGFAAASFAALPPGTAAPDFALPTTQDSSLSLTQFRGQVVILAFWKSN
jgi:hypothetical protein